MSKIVGNDRISLLLVSPTQKSLAFLAYPSSIRYFMMLSAQAQFASQNSRKHGYRSESFRLVRALLGLRSKSVLRSYPQTMSQRHHFSNLIAHIMQQSGMLQKALNEDSTRCLAPTPTWKAEVTPVLVKPFQSMNSSASKPQGSRMSMYMSSGSVNLQRNLCWSKKNTRLVRRNQSLSMYFSQTASVLSLKSFWQSVKSLPRVTPMGTPGVEVVVFRHAHLHSVHDVWSFAYFAAFTHYITNQINYSHHALVFSLCRGVSSSTVSSYWRREAAGSSYYFFIYSKCRHSKSVSMYPGVFDFLTQFLMSCLDLNFSYQPWLKLN